MTRDECVAAMTVDQLREIVHPPRPGSDEAVDRGCICPVEENGFGHGAVDPQSGCIGGYWQTQGCPVHEPTGEARALRTAAVAELASRYRRGCCQ